MTITYRIEDSLYLNITNRCTNACSFCIRTGRDTMGDGESLWLDGTEPSREEIWADILRRGIGNYREIVFCGYGEPLMRFDDVLWLCGRLKKAGAPLVRINTNGHADLITGRDTASALAGLVDIISISLNARDAGQYQALCSSVYGERAFDAVLMFARRCIEAGIPQVVLSVLDILPKEDIEACRKIADSIGAGFRVRSKM